MTGNDEYIVEILESMGIVDYEQARAALQQSQEQDIDVIDLLDQAGVVPKRQSLNAVASQFGMETVSLKEVDIAQELIDLVPAETARRFRIIPLYRTDHSLTVALGDPFDVDTLDGLRYVLKCNVEGAVAPTDEIDDALNHYYAFTADSVDHALQDIQDDSAVGLVDGEGDALAEGVAVTEADAPIIKLVSLIILEAFRNRASDIHLEPMARHFRVRYRIDGVLHEVDSPPKKLQSAIISRLKIMANMKMSEKRVPQDGRIMVPVMDRQLDLRVSSVPTNHGESIVMRILDKQGLMLGLPQLGFLADDQATFEQLIDLADGIILVTGPTGSGKTTTLYACLNQINKPDRKIITVEDPVEYQISGINQVQVRADIGMTFSAALRAILRQAPNIIMIGEIRDLETAEIAVNASLTGHLVFSTLHTNDAPSAVTRLIDIGVKPFLVSTSTQAIMAQRLVRKICKKCREEYTPTETELRLLGNAAEQMAHSTLFKGTGCSECGMTGYKGRAGLYEILRINEEMRHMIYEQMGSTELRSRARALGMRTLREDGLRKILNGMTTLEEVLRVTMGDNG